MQHISFEFGKADKTTPAIYVECGMVLYIVWKERNARAIIPVEYWPTSEEQVEQTIKIYLPGIEAAKGAAEVQSKLRQAKRDAYYRKLMPGVAKMVRVTSRNNPTKVYIIKVHGTGAKECNCPDFIYRRKKRGELCKHIAEYMKRTEKPAEVVLEKPKTPVLSTTPVLKNKSWYISWLPGMGVDEFFEEEWASFVERKAAKLRIKHRGLSV